MYECMVACSPAMHAAALNFLTVMKFFLVPVKIIKKDFAW